MFNLFLSMIIFMFLFSEFCFANVVGSDAQNFAPTQDGIDYVTVHASEALEPGVFNFGFFINYAQNTFPAFDGQGEVPQQSLLNSNDSLTSADINFAIGVFRNLQFGISFPYILNQTIEKTENLGRFEGRGTSEIRPALKYRFLKLENWGFASVLSANFNQIKNNPYLGEGAGPTWNLEFVFDRAFDRWNWSLNFGHRWRNSGDPIEDTGIDPLPNQWIYSTAVSYLFTQIDTKVIGELYGSQPEKETPNLSNRQNSSLEALIGLKHDVNENISVHLGSGTELQKGTSTPDWRVYTGINIGLSTKGKGIFEKKHKKRIELTLPNLRFVFNSDQLTTESLIIVDELVERIQKLGEIKMVRIEGHTDSIGVREYNKELSQKRADLIKKILIERVPLRDHQVQSMGMGEDYPIASNGNYQGRKTNRRVQIKIEY